MVFNSYFAYSAPEIILTGQEIGMTSEGLYIPKYYKYIVAVFIVF